MGNEMGRSSIALLQERFRELHRVKVVRQQKEEVLMRSSRQLSNSLSDINPIPNLQYSINFNFELLEPAERESKPLFMQHRPTSPCSQLSLWPTTTSQLHNKRKREDDEDHEYCTRTKTRRRGRKFINSDEIPLLINLWPTVNVVTDTSCSSSSSRSLAQLPCSSNKYLETSNSDYCNNSDDDDVDTSLHL